MFPKTLIMYLMRGYMFPKTQLNTLGMMMMYQFYWNVYECRESCLEWSGEIVLEAAIDVKKRS